MMRLQLLMLTLLYGAVLVRALDLPAVGDVVKRLKGSKSEPAKTYTRQKRQAPTSDPKIIFATTLPMKNNTINTRYMPTLGNGHIGTTVYGTDLYLNGLYNGDSTDSHRAAIPAVVMTRVILEEEVERTANRRFYFDSEKGTFLETIDCTFAYIEHRTYVHQRYIRLLVTDLFIRRKPGFPAGGILRFNYPQFSSTGDFTWSNIREERGAKIANGMTKRAETGAQRKSVHVYFHRLVREIPIRGSAWLVNETMVMSTDTAEAAAKNEFDIANNILSQDPTQTEGHYQLLQEHIEAWKKTWNEGRVEIDGDIHLNRIIRFSQFYLLSSLPAKDPNSPPQTSQVFTGVSRSSLSKGGGVNKNNMGHVMWDSEMYILPAVLLFHPYLAKEILRYRTYHQVRAKEYAASLGLEGWRFPWRGATMGNEVVTDGCSACSVRQHHVNGAIVFGIRLYYSATRDRDFLINPEYNGCELSREIAHYFFSLARYNTSKGRYDIPDVTGPDQYHPNVLNNAYTNVLASLAIHWARYQTCICGRNYMEEIPDEMIQAAMHLHVPYDAVKRLHYQHEAYGQLSEAEKRIKQADAVMMGFPLNWNMSYDIWRNDLEFYEPLTDHDTPAMTHSFHTVGWKWVQDYTRAQAAFLKSYLQYISSPFLVWTEYSEGSAQEQPRDAVNFLPGAGGFMQSIIYGYAGIRIRPEMLEFHNPIPPPGAEVLRLVSFKYLGANMTIEIFPKETNIVVHSLNDHQLVLRKNRSYEDANDLIPLSPGKTTVIQDPQFGFYIYSTTGTSCEHPKDCTLTEYSPWCGSSKNEQISSTTSEQLSSTTKELFSSTTENDLVSTVSVNKTNMITRSASWTLCLLALIVASLIKG